MKSKLLLSLAVAIILSGCAIRPQPVYPTPCELLEREIEVTRRNLRDYPGRVRGLRKEIEVLRKEDADNKEALGQLLERHLKECSSTSS